MIAVETNILVYALRSESPHHKAASQALCSLEDNAVRWVIPWPCVHEFYGIITHPRIYSPPMKPEDGLAILKHWSSSSYLSFIGEGPGYLDKLRALCEKGKIVGPKVHDAKIAAICLNHGVKELWTADRDFSLFPDLNTSNPLIT